MKKLSILFPTLLLLVFAGFYTKAQDKHLAVGDKAPQFSLYDQDGKLTEYRRGSGDSGAFLNARLPETRPSIPGLLAIRADLPGIFHLVSVGTKFGHYVLRNSSDFDLTTKVRKRGDSFADEDLVAIL